MDHAPDLKQIRETLESGAAQQAEEMCRLCLKECSNARDFEDLENLLGYTLLAQRRFDEARQLYHDLYDRSGDHRFLHQQAMVEREAGCYEEALDLIRRESDLLQPGSHLELAANLYEASLLSYFLEKEEDAHLHAEACLKHALQCDDDIMQGCAWRLCGELAKGDPDTARNHFHKALEVFERAGDSIAVTEIRYYLENLGPSLKHPGTFLG